MICWSCEKAAGDGATCVSCGAIQPVDAKADFFRVLGVEARYAIDVAEVEGRFRELSRVVHPDKFATADSRARRAALGRSVQLNEAWRTLKDPVRRAEYLLGLAGYEVGAESGASRPGPDGKKERVPAPMTLLSEILELREELSDAHASGDEARVGAMAANVRARMEAAMAGVAKGFARAGAAGAGRTAALESVLGELIAVRYFRRFLEEVERVDDADDIPIGEEAGRA